MLERVLEALLERETVSGQALSEELGVTRAAVWKQIEQLRAMGFAIDSSGRQGYRLISCPDSLMGPVVRKGMNTRRAGCEIRFFPEVDSTNRLARRLAAEGAPEGTLVLADTQTAGRGRRGRGWVSAKGEGIFMTMILRPKCHPSKVAQLSLQTALAVARAIARETGLDARIKWPNDIVISGRKVCGMLLEMNADEQSVHDVVAGIGINVHQREFPEEIARSASSLDLLTGKTISRAAVIRAFLAAYEEVEALAAQGGDAFMEAYRERSATLGRRVQVVGLSETFTGTAISVTDSGTLIVLDDEGKEREVLAADVSVRGLMGYA